MLEALHVSQEELRRQNEALAAARILLEKERQRYQDLFEFAPDAYLVTNQDGRIDEANQAACTLLGRPRDFLVGKPLAVFVAEENRRAFRDGLTRMRFHPGRYEWAFRLIPKGQPPRDALATVVRERQGRPVGLRWLLRDVTARSQADRLRMLGEMVTGLAHESRNALQRMQACLSLLSLRLQGQPEALGLLERMQKARDDLQRLFDEVRDFAAPVALSYETCSLPEIWRGA